MIFFSSLINLFFLALKVTSSYDCVDYQGNRRRAGEEWLVTGLGAYLPGITETVSCVQDSITLNWKTALKLKAKTNFKDFKGQERRAAEGIFFFLLPLVSLTLPLSLLFVI